MKKLLFLLIILLYNISAFTQDCGGVPCIANPNIIQEEIVICYQEVLDSNSWCGPESPNTCYQVCKNSYNTYSTAYNVGSNYSWVVTGGQIVTTNNTGNIISVLWGPQGSGNVTVEESDSTGCSKIVSACIDIITTPIASILTIPNSTTICQNTNIQFLGENLNTTTLSSSLNDSCTQQTNWDSTGTYTYDLVYFWDFGDGSTSIDQNPYHTYNTPGTYLVSLIIANSCQCADTVTTTIEVINTLGPEITTTCIGTVCEGDTVEYCTNAVSPSWTIEGGVLYNSLNTDNCINVIWDNYDNELNDGLGSLLLADLSSSCGSSESIMNIPAVPTNPFITGEVNPCDMTTQKYSFACIPGVDYDWQIIGAPWGVSIVDGWGTSEIIIENQWVWGASYQIELSITSSTLECSFNTITLNIDVLPTLDLYGNSDICDGSVSTYYSSSGGILEWEVLNGTIQSPAGPPYIASQIDVLWDQGYGTGIVKAVPTSIGIFCNDLATLSVNIIEIPTAAIKILGDSLICPGSTYMYSVEESNVTSSSNVSYNWTVIGGVASITNGEVCTITWDPAGPYSIEITNTLLSYPNCSSPVFTKTINTVPVITPVISGSYIACLNSVSTFNLSTIYPSWAVISWSVSNPNLGSVVVGQGSSQVQVEWGNQNGTTDVVIDVEVCGVTYSQAFSITLLNQSISFTFSNPVCSETIVSFGSTGGLGTYNWDFGDNTSSFLPNPNKSYDEPGNYLVHLTFTDAANQCVSTYSSVIDVQGIAGKLMPENTTYFCSSLPISQQLNIVSNVAFAPTIEWYHNGNLVGAGNSYPVSSSPPLFSEIGSYLVVLTDANGCYNTLNIIIIDTVSCSGTGCPPFQPILYTSSCNASNGTMIFDFQSPNGNPVDWQGGGTSINYQKTYTEAGIYTVSCYDPLTNCIVGKEQVTVPVVVETEYSTICDPLNGNQITYFFQDRSSYLLGYGTATYLCDFGDATPTSNLQNPSHVYASNGTYNVNFSVTYGAYSCNKTTTITVTDFNVSYSYSGLECENTPTITFASVSSPTNIDSWNWDFGDGASSGREIPRRTYNSSSTYITTLLVTDVNGCQASDNLPIIIKQNPIISPITNLGPFCSNDNPTDLTSVVTFTTSNGEVASWSGIGIDYDPVTQIYYFNPMLAGGGSHTVCVTVTDINGCYDIECINIDVLCPNKPRIFGESDYCEDIYYQYLQTQNGFTDYTWYVDNVLHSGPSNWGYNYSNNSTVGTYDITVSFEDNNGCTGTSEVFILQVHPTPNSVYVSSTGICPGTQITLTHNGGQSNVDYYWNTIPQQTGSSVDVIAEDNYQYQVIGVNQFGCESTSYNWVEIPNNVNMYNILSGCFCDDEIMNSAGLINITGLNNSWQYSNYEWLLNGISFSPLQNASSLIIDPLDPNYLTICAGVITLAVTDNNGCLSVSDPLTIEPNCICSSIQSVFYVNSEICEGDTLHVGSNIYSSPGYYSDSLLSTQGCDSIIHTNLTVYPLLTSNQYIDICQGDSVVIGFNVYDSAGVYIDTLNNIVGCDSVIMTQITISEPLVNFTLVSSLLIAQVTGGVIPYYYEFGNQNGIILTSSNNFGSSISFNPIVNGIYYFFIIDANNCVSDTVFYLVDIFPTLMDEFGVGSLNIFPNPSKDVFNITFTSETIQDLKVRILNVVGEELINEDLQQFIGEYTKQIDLTNNAKGIYFLEIETNDGVINKKLILQ